jgi:hypothetical protein
MSPGAALGALALKLAVAPDDEALVRIRHRLTQRQIGAERGGSSWSLAGDAGRSAPGRSRLS